MSIQGLSKLLSKLALVWGGEEAVDLKLPRIGNG